MDIADAMQADRLSILLQQWLLKLQGLRMLHCDKGTF
jgi:hypothetical protein